METLPVHVNFVVEKSENVRGRVWHIPNQHSFEEVLKDRFKSNFDSSVEVTLVGSLVVIKQLRFIIFFTSDSIDIELNTKKFN